MLAGAVPRRFFGGFLIAQKATRRPQAAKSPKSKGAEQNRREGGRALPPPLPTHQIVQTDLIIVRQLDQHLHWHLNAAQLVLGVDRLADTQIVRQRRLCQVAVLSQLSNPSENHINHLTLVYNSLILTIYF